MAVTLCDSLLASDIQGYNCDKPMTKGVGRTGIILNRSDIQIDSVTKEANVVTAMPLKSGKKGYTIVQGGKTPFNGSQQEMVEGTYQNTINNTIQFAILQQGDLTTAKVVDALLNGEFVVVLTNNYASTPDLSHQIYGLDTGLHASAMVRELYSEDTLAGWLVTLLEEGAGSATWYLADEVYATLTQAAQS